MKRSIAFKFDHGLQVQAVEIQADTKEAEADLKEIAFKMMEQHEPEFKTNRPMELKT